MGTNGFGERIGRTVGNLIYCFVNTVQGNRLNTDQNLQNQTSLCDFCATEGFQEIFLRDIFFFLQVCPVGRVNNHTCPFPA